MMAFGRREDHTASALPAVLLTLLLIIGAPAESAADSSPDPCDFPAIFNFGDSNSDTGGLSAAFGPSPPPNGETFFGRPAGRYSDGRLIVDFIAKSLGVPYLSAYLNSIGANFSHGANFATAGSTIRRQNTTLFQSGFSPFSLDVQTWQFTQFKSRSQYFYQQGGFYKEVLPSEVYFSEALYTFDIGQNDLTAGYFLGMTTDEVKAYIPDVLNEFTTAIKSVYSEGGRYFWVHNTGPFGCLPYVLDRLTLRAPEVDHVGCGTPFNGVALKFNSMLKDTIAQLRRELPLAAFTYVDVYSVKYELISQAKKYGFEHPLMACCGHGGAYNYDRNFGCGSKMTVNGTEVMLGKSCGDPLARVNWDGVHYTEAANKWVFDQISEGAFSDPSLPIRMACYKHSP
ncbi:GDSL esterase/lipase [Apostasia shenzhenica]|uniref:GDSL esterase/lipase n=1 Tax=Apostasia shenzhenica TaxID=1088818 RepID=A0A2I0BED3_9ASPA|nr:GDSL esterase/lipase [Apostasia shenzhenica]